MIYDLEWTENAVDGLAELTLLYADRWPDINFAIDLIDYRLTRGPFAHGREVSEGLFRIDVEPVGVCFFVSQTTVTVDSIGWIG